MKELSKKKYVTLITIMILVLWDNRNSKYRKYRLR